MNPGSKNIRLVQRAQWLIRMRWIAIAFLAAITFFCSNILKIELQDLPIYCIVVLLAIYNTLMLLLLNHVIKTRKEVPYYAVKRIINVQISADLLILTVLLHFAGGIENPFVFFFIFHMVIASILLSVKESYLHAAFATLLLGLLVLLEHTGKIEHHCLKEGFIPQCLQQKGMFVFGTYAVFTVAMFLMVYMASYVAVRLRHAEQARKQANVLLREKDRIKDEYVSRVTHDLKGHLAAIQSCLAVVANETVGPLNKKQLDFVDRAHNRTKKLTRFVRTLLRLTQMRLSDKFEMAHFLLKETIENAVAAVNTKAEEKSIVLSCNVRPPTDKVFGNQFSIEEMITNLLLNAIKYTPPEGTIAVNASNSNDVVVLEIADTGIGIPEDEIDKVFDEFFRASNAKKHERDGTGLGLAIAKQIIERHGGSISVESQLGRGTTFRLTLPKKNS